MTFIISNIIENVIVFPEDVFSSRVTVQPFGFSVTESAHSRCLRSTPVGAGQTSPGRLAPCGEGQIPSWLNLHVLTDFAVNAKSWAELLPYRTDLHVYVKSF